MFGFEIYQTPGGKYAITRTLALQVNLKLNSYLIFKWVR